MRQIPLVTNEYYHVCNKSIAGYQIFNDEKEFLRMIEVLRLSRSVDATIPLSQLLNLETPKIRRRKASLREKEHLVRLLAYCIMPTHLHLILQQKQEEGISKFMSRIQNSYARFFNLRHVRKGPLWQGRFERIWIENDMHLLHETRYVHLNPVTAYLVEDPAAWPYSSYVEYLTETPEEGSFCEFRDLINMGPSFYRKFVLSDKENQRARAKAKKNVF